MGVTYLTVKVKNPKGGKQEFERRFLVDSGAVYSVMPESILKKLKVAPHSKRSFILANGQEIEKSVGDATFLVQDKVATTPVVFGDEGVFLLGVVTLEALGLIIDPISRTLRPLPMMI